MDRVFACPDCGHQTTYDPKDCWARVRFSLKDGKTVQETYLLVRCAGCGKEHEVPEAEA